MPQYTYTARDATGGLVQDTIEGDTLEAVTQALFSRGLTPTSIEENRTGLKKDISIGFMKRYPNKLQLAVFSKQFSVLLRAGVPVARALNTLRLQATNVVFQEILAEVLRDIETGGGLTAALRNHPKVFNTIYVSLVESGEKSGTIEITLGQLAHMLEKEVVLERKIKSALTYPGFVFSAAMLITYFLMTSIVPQFATILTDMGTKLPLITQIVMGLSDILRTKSYLIAIAIAAVVFGYRAYAATDKGRLQLDTLLLKVPIFGNLIKKTMLARINRATGVMLRSGLNIIEVLTIAQEISGNRVMQNALSDIASNVEMGETMYDSFSRYDKLFPPIMTGMIQIGEDSGAIDELLTQVAEFYDEEVNEIAGSLASLIEPVLTVFMGSVVAIIVLAMFLPYFSIISTLSQ